MPIQVEKNLPQKYIVCSMMGIGTLDEVKNYLDDLAIDPDLDQPFFEIVDFTQVENLEFGYYQSEEMMNKYVSLAENKGYKGTIFITGSDYGQGIANMFSAAGTFKGLDLRVVSDLAEAEQVVANFFSTNKSELG